MATSLEVSAITGVIVSQNDSQQISALLETLEGLNPSVVISALKDPTKGGIFTDLSKYVPQSYNKAWNKLALNQCKVIIEIYQKLTVAQKSKLLQLNDPLRTESCTKNDKVRLLELRVLPAAQQFWSIVLGSQLTRQMIDQLNSSVSPEADNASNAWIQLVNIYNNRVQLPTNLFQPYNSAVRIEANGTKVNAKPDVLSMDSFERVRDLNPNELDRPIRDKEFLKKHYNELKASITLCHSKFLQSGNHNGSADVAAHIATKEGVDEWMLRFAQDDVVAYSCLIMDASMLENLGKALPPHAARESGIVEAGMNEEERRIANMQVPKPKSMKRAQQRAAMKERNNATNVERSDIINHLDNNEEEENAEDRIRMMNEESYMAYATSYAADCHMDEMLLNNLKDNGNVDHYNELLEDLCDRRKRQRRISSSSNASSMIFSIMESKSNNIYH